MTSPVQSSPLLPRQRNFPREEVIDLANEIDKTYIDMAARINDKTIGIYPLNASSVTGDQYYLKGQPIQTQRQLYSFTTFAAINHGMTVGINTFFIRMYGVFTNV